MPLLALRDALIRSRAKLHEVPLDTYEVRVARTPEELEAALSLLRKAYVECGLEAPQARSMRVTDHHALRESAVFIALDRERVVATMTTSLDSPVRLPLDESYPEALGALRRSGARPVELGSFAVDRDHRRTGVTTLLFMASQWTAFRIYGGTHLVIGVRARYEGLYRALFDFRRLGAPRRHASLNAKGIGMSQSMNRIMSHLRRRYGDRMADGRPLSEGFLEQLPECIELPEAWRAGRPNTWQLPRHTFQEIFLRRNGHLSSLSTPGREYARSQRTDETLSVELTGVRP